ncbi:A24 family peptidase [Lelliottia sp. SL45]|jgi:leader peptidase HopD|uniref:prepilin peptidase n=1 Tax=Lelliottia TaxID=1330545 RepID=UPI000FB81930|nr:A24 family peptidase [Lelliottia sp. SL45]MCY1696706.1 A24 family peptidase [Lelliottia sp. SL45]MDH6630973.1 leader peptidase HopD [Lelliottia amnigena]
MLTALPFLMLYAILTCLLVREDIRSGLLPDKYLCPLLWTGLLFHLTIHPDFLASAVMGAMAGYIGFACIYWGYRMVFKREGLGYGDVKYLAALGAWHGWCVLPAMALSAAILAISFVLIQMVMKPGQQIHKNPLPFGPFLAAAGLVSGWQSLLNLPL